MLEVVRCPECDAGLRPKQLGVKIRCPKCETVFTPTTGEEEAPRRRTAQRAAWEDKPRPRKKQTSSLVGLIIVLVVVLALVVLSGAGVGAYFLFFYQAEKKSDGGSASDKPTTSTTGNTNTPSNPGEPINAGLTVENFQKLSSQMTEAEVILILGIPTSTRSGQVPVGGPMGNPIPTRERIWEKKDAEKKTLVTLTFTVDGVLLAGIGKIDGKPVTLRQSVSRVSRANYSKIAGKIHWTKSQIEEILGRPTKSLGPQQIAGNFRSAESYEYSDGVNRIVVHWYADGKFGGIEMHTGLR